MIDVVGLRETRLEIEILRRNRGNARLFVNSATRRDYGRTPEGRFIFRARASSKTGR